MERAQKHVSRGLFAGTYVREGPVADALDLRNLLARACVEHQHQHGLPAVRGRGLRAQRARLLGGRHVRAVRRHAQGGVPLAQVGGEGLAGVARGRVVQCEI